MRVARLKCPRELARDQVVVDVVSRTACPNGFVQVCTVTICRQENRGAAVPDLCAVRLATTMDGLCDAVDNVHHSLVTHPRFFAM